MSSANRLALAVAAFVLILNVTAVSQQKETVDKTKPTEVTSTGSSFSQLVLEISETGALSVWGVSADGKSELSAADLRALTNDSRASSTPSVFQQFVVEKQPTATISDLWRLIVLLRRTGNVVSLSVPTGSPVGYHVSLNLPKPNADPGIEVKPNPLLLVVRLDDNGKILLNNESAGSLLKPEPLAIQLTKIFKAREVNGVFREGGNEVEKSVVIFMPMNDRKLSDLITIAKVVWAPGADPIDLVMDDPLGELIIDRKDILPVPLKPPRKRRP